MRGFSFRQGSPARTSYRLPEPGSFKKVQWRTLYSLNLKKKKWGSDWVREKFLCAIPLMTEVKSILAHIYELKQSKKEKNAKEYRTGKSYRSY